ncbi:hypothetical protein [Luteibacter sp. SG786]|uniref:hypothetical protein n=1 Tax=Luteibacter sp. SG786 TaxID=2587130 RepID=UPI00142472F9|nr:hypothetical protein [Luteibacter sp. SG786]NII55539.1 hypothetical protein [Luteibacter sp. SG786]
MVTVAVSRWLIGTFILSAAAFLYLHISDWYVWQGHVESRPQPTIAKLKEGFREFPFANEARLISSFDKDESVSVNYKFQSDLPPAQIAGAFKVGLKRLGWHMERENIARDAMLKFCRSGTATTIRLISIDPGTEANVHLSWTYNVRSPDYCAVAP